MAKAIKVERNGELIGYAIECPACNTHHVFIDGRWTFNNDFDKPTFSPSMLVTSGHYLPNHQGTCWCDYNREHPDEPAPFECSRCHSFVTDGNIQFLGDCTHQLAGQTVELPEILYDDYN